MVGTPGRQKTFTFRKFFSEVTVNGKKHMRCILKRRVETADDNKDSIEDCNWQTEVRFLNENVCK